MSGKRLNGILKNESIQKIDENYGNMEQVRDIEWERQRRRQELRNNNVNVTEFIALTNTCMNQLRDLLSFKREERETGHHKDEMELRLIKCLFGCDRSSNTTVNNSSSETTGRQRPMISNKSPPSRLFERRQPFNASCSTPTTSTDTAGIVHSGLKLESVSSFNHDELDEDVCFSPFVRYSADI